MGNKTFLFWTVSLLLTLVLGFCQSAQAGGELVTVEASGVGSDVESAAKAGLAQAVRTATGQLPSGGKFQLLLTESVAASADDFATGYEIINKRHEEDEYAARHPELNLDHPGEWQVQLSVKINAVALRKRWDELSGLLEKKTLVILILGQDVVNGQPTGESVSADAISKVLGKFSVKTLTIDDIPQGSDLAGPVTFAQAIAIAGELKADMVIIAQAKIVPGQEVGSSRPETTIGLSLLDGGKPIESITNSLKLPPGAEVADPGRQDLIRQARILMPQLLDGFFKAWPEALANSIEQIEQKTSPKQAEVE